MKNSTLYLGDCLEVLPLLNPAHAVIADPPYGTTNCRWDSVIPLDEMWKGLKRVTRSNTPIVLTSQTPFDKVLGASNISKLRYEWIWHKTLPTGHLNAKKMPMKAHENILVFYDKLPTYNPQKTAGHERKSATRLCTSELYGKQRSASYSSTERYPRSVQTFSTDKQKSALHPTQKPIALMEYLIRTYTNPGDTVLDFVMGSGTTGAAAIRLGRKFIGVEIDEKYFNIALQRIDEISQQELVFL